MGVKWWGLEVDHSFPLSVNIIISDSIPSLQMDGMERDKFTFSVSTDDYY